MIIIYNEVQKKKAAARARKCLEKNYKKVAANIRNEAYEEWQSYAEEREISISSLIVKSVERSIADDYFGKSSENVEKK